MIPLIILGVIACFLIVALMKNRDRDMTTEKFRAYYNRLRKEEREIENLRKELRKEDK
ncbi:hypothetical protein ES703_27696 [subsurface metagenome]